MHSWITLPASPSGIHFLIYNSNQIIPNKPKGEQKQLVMKKTIFTLATILLTACHSIFAQENKSTVAIANPNITGLYATPEIGTKLIYLEMIKINKYKVLDEFDMQSLYETNPDYKKCLSKECLVNMGKELNVDYTVSGSFDLLANKIVISLKFIDVANNTIFLSGVKEFDNQEEELQRMVEILLKEMHGIPVEKELNDRLVFKNEVITSNNVGRINNSGPRIGYAALVGDYFEFANRSSARGGLDIFPAVSMIGYQIEGQYVGTENFSALVEGIINISGLEQGQFIPSISIMNGFRFGKAGWEFAFGPAFSLKKTTAGFFDTEAKFGEKDQYFSESDWNRYLVDNELDIYSTPDTYHSSYNFDSQHADTRGATKINTSFIFAFGRTFRAGALNIPVNAFYSSQRGGGMAGVSVGFNVMKSKKPINPKDK